jgi:hypothetical protein
MMLSSLDDEINPEYSRIKMNNTEQSLIQFMTDWGNLSGLRNTAALDEMLPDDLVMTMADGTFLTKREYLGGFQTISADFAITDFDQNATVYHETAIVTARYIVKTGNEEIPLRYTTTFIKREGRWQPVAFHSCLLTAG